MVYLTSRPIVLAPKTRAFLISVEQDRKSLPLGPLLCSLYKVSGVLWREVSQLGGRESPCPPKHDQTI